RVFGAALREEIAAKQRARRQLVDEAAVPTVRHVRRVEPLDRVPAELEPLTVREAARRPVGIVAHADEGTDTAAYGLRVRRHGQKLVQRAAFVGLEVRERNVA